VDYVISLGDKIVPVEVKSGISGAQKSLNLFIDLKSSNLAIILSGSNFPRHERVYSCPFYAVESIVKDYDNL